MKYFKSQLYHPNPDPEYYRVHPDGHYEYFHKGYDHWNPGFRLCWDDRFKEWPNKPIEVSKLEVLIVLGLKAINEDI